MKTKIALVLLLVSVLPAAAAPPVPIVLGHGANSCTDYAQGRLVAQQLDNSYFDWAQGFMSAMNTMLASQKNSTHNVYRLSDDGMKKALQAYCNAHPADMFEVAVTKVFLAQPETPAPSP
jgi:hypothetical protein